MHRDKLRLSDGASYCSDPQAVLAYLGCHPALPAGVQHVSASALAQLPAQAAAPHRAATRVCSAAVPWLHGEPGTPQPDSISEVVHSKPP